jgi:predicted DNA-binding transcriptional regulator YafY
MRQAMQNNNDLVIRQLTMLRLIPRYPQKITATNLVEKLTTEGFSVSKRTIERDLQAMSSIFPLASDERNKPYGWSWSADAPAIDLPGLTASEALTLKLAEQYLVKLMPTSMVQQLHPYFKAADLVLGRHANSTQLASWPEKIAVALPTQPLIPPKINHQISETIDEGLLKERQIQIEYLNRGETETKPLTVHPLGIILRGQISYLCCQLFNYEEVRLLAFHRIKEATLLDSQARRPKGFNLKHYANSGALGFGDDKMVDITLRFTKEAGLHLYETPLSENQEITEDGEFLIVKASVFDTPQLKWWINGFGESVRIL